MVPEKAFTDKEQKELAATPLHTEMAVAQEWISREERDPDQLFTIFVAPTVDGELQAACACLRGARDLPCIHALDVFQKIRANPVILNEVFKRGCAAA